jgi:hypothetical protein
VASLLVTALFVLRPIPLTSDEGFYVEYFSGYREYGDVLLFAMIDEPLFKLYTNFFHGVATPDVGVRILILLSILPHLVVRLRFLNWAANLQHKIEQVRLLQVQKQKILI